MQSIEQICFAVGVNPSSYYETDISVKQRFADAIKKGHAVFAGKLLSQYEERMPKNDTLLMFGLKQGFGTGWSDQVAESKHSGKIEIVLREEIMTGESAIDITPTQALPDPTPDPNEE